MTSTTDGTKDGPALYGAGGGWNETELAWSNRPSHDATAADDIAAIPKGTVADYNAESLVNGNGLVNMALISDLQRQRGLRVARARGHRRRGRS